MTQHHTRTMASVQVTSRPGTLRVLLLSWRCVCSHSFTTRTMQWLHRSSQGTEQFLDYKDDPGWTPCLIPWLCLLTRKLINRQFFILAFQKYYENMKAGYAIIFNFVNSP